MNTIEDIKRRERNKRDEEAHQYVEFVEQQYGPFRSKAYTDTVLYHMNLKTHEAWLDAGSGVGRLSLEIAPRIEKLVCVDHSMYSLLILRENAASRGLKNIHTVHSDVCNFVYEQDTFHGILCNEVLQHIPAHAERIRALKNLYRTLRRGGRCLVNVIHWRYPGNGEKEGYWGENQEIYRYYFTHNEIKEAMEEAGFHDVSVRGMDIMHPRLCNMLPVTFAFLERWLSLLPRSYRWGYNLLAIGNK